MAYSSVAEAVDSCFADYYDFRQVAGYTDASGVGKFSEFLRLNNGYDTDMITDEVDGEAHDCSMLDFDEAFPTHLTGDYRKEFIFSILKLGVSLYQPSSASHAHWDSMTGAYHIFKHKGKLCPVSHTEFAVICPEDILDERHKRLETRHYTQRIWLYNSVSKSWRQVAAFESWTR